MKIKIGNFNFISESKNKYGSYDNLNENTKYFYLDGKEDTLFVTSITEFEREKYGQSMQEYEKDLKSKYKVVHIYGELRNQVNQYINNKVEQFFKNRNYSKYELYKDMDLNQFNQLNYNSKFDVGYRDELVLDFEMNKINIGEFQLNPYTEKIDNLDEIFQRGILNEYIKNNLILKEIEKGIAPPYIYELKKIDNFIQEKKNLNLIFKDCEKFKSEARVSNIIKLANGKFDLNLSYNAGKNFEMENPEKKVRNLKLEDFKGISYGKNVLEVDGRVFANANKQIAITLEDRLKQKVDSLKEDIKEEYYNFRNKMDDYVPYSLADTVKEIKEKEEQKEKIAWHNKELDEIIHKNNLINFLEQAKTIEDIKDVCIELGDNELQNIYYGMLYEEENYECEEEEEENN